MSTLTQMEKTVTGWKCPRCGSQLDDHLGISRSAECNCEGLEAFRQALAAPIAQQIAAQSRNCAEGAGRVRVALRGSDDPDWDADPTCPSEAWEREDL